MIQHPARPSSGPSHSLKAARATLFGPNLRGLALRGLALRGLALRGLALRGLALRGLAGALALAVVAGCSSSRLGGTVFVHPNADLAAFERVAVLPLDNLSNDRYASERVREVLNIELAAMGLFEVVDSTRVNRALRDLELIDVTGLGQETLIQLAETLEVQGLLLGSVLELSQARTSTFVAPEVSLSLRLVDAQTGIVAWSVTDARKGLPLETRLFGVGEKTQTEVIRELVRTLMSDLYRAAGS